MSETIRAFVAVPLGDVLARTMVAEQARLAKVAPSAKWIPRERMHLLLGYLGERSPALLWKIQQQLERVRHGERPFPIPARGLRVWSTATGIVRGIAVALGPDQKDILKRLVDWVRAAAKLAGVPEKEVDYRGATLRIGAGPVEGQDAEALQVEARKRHRWEYGDLWVDRIVLYESKLDGASPPGEIEYKPLTVIELDAE